MQFSRYLTYKKSSQSFQVWSLLLKAILIAASFYYIISKLVEEQLGFSTLAGLFKSIDFVFLFLLIAVLMLANWLLESKKWQLIAREHQPISLFKAIKAVLAGVSLDAILPFGSGAVGSKVLSLKGNGREHLIAPIILAQGIQSLWTMVFGLIGLYQLTLITDVIAIYGGMRSILIIISLIIIVIISIFKFWPKSVISIIYTAQRLPRSSWVKILVISLIRYLVFFTQLLLLSIYMSPEIPIATLVGCITWMFFAKTIIPKPGHLGAVGIRGAAVVFFLTLADYAPGQVVIATIMLWVINLAIPSLVGLFFVKELNFRTENAL